LTPLGRALVGLGLLPAIALLGFAVRRGLAPDPVVRAGKALFAGDVPLKARMVGHDTDLPSMAVRCSNCHSRQPVPSAVATSPTADLSLPRDTFGSSLSRLSLLDKRSRRGGPPSRYQEASFCRVLREGIDPASVMIAQTMPRYRVTDEECHQLWTFAIDE
jgi:hypothetical protein